MNILRKIIYGTLLGIFPICLSAQVDTEFWFVVPDVFSESGDIPLTLVVSSIGSSETVQISQPANPTFEPISLFLNPYEVKIIDLSSFQKDLVNKPADQVLNKGLFIEGSGPVMAYFHVEHPANQDIFTLKGRDALGKEFFIPSQTDFRNRFGRSTFDIVATEDQTEVRIRPSQAIAGHAAGISFSILLNKGQTFTARALGPEVEDHLGGSHILSDKPIAITLSDDAITHEGGSDWDLVGDQLLPLQHLGTEYLAMRGDATTERLYILATQDNTEVSFPASSQRIPLQRGETHAHTLSQPSLYLESNAPVYVLQLSGYEDSPAGAILYPLSCTGTNIVKYVRPDGINFIKYLLTPSENVNDFKLNGTDNVGPFYFSQATGPDSDWSVGRVEGLGGFTTSTNQLNNEAGIFHMGMVATTGQGASFAYFSDIHQGSSTQTHYICPNQPLELKARNGMENPLWSSGATTNSLTVDSLGTYWVTGEIAGCPVRDTLEVQEISLSLGSDTLLCPDSRIEIQLPQGIGTYLWEDGEIGSSRVLKAGDTLSVELSAEACTLKDTLEVGVLDLGSLDLGPDTSLCEGDTLILDLSHQEGALVWQDGESHSRYKVSEAGSYWVERRVNGCIQQDTLQVEEAIAAAAQIIDTSLCLGDTLLLSADLEQLPFQWEDGFAQALRRVSQSGTYTAYIRGVCLSAPYSWELSFEDCSCKPFMPNVFSPNNDGINDVFAPQLSCPLESYELTVFNRWGESIFKSSDPAEPWQGQNGRWLAPETVYFYQLTFKSLEEEVGQVLTGQVLLLR